MCLHGTSLGVGGGWLILLFYNYLMFSLRSGMVFVLGFIWLVGFGFCYQNSVLLL